MTTTHITHNVPADRVDFLVALATATGGTLVARTVESDGEFTLVFSFPDGDGASSDNLATPETKTAAPTVPSGISGTNSPVNPEPKWLTIARAELKLNVEERPGTEDNPRIVSYHQSTKGGADHDSVPWCSSFVNWCVEQAGLKGSDSKLARSWLGWGEPINEPRVGCIIVLERGPAPQGHVGFLTDAKPGFVTLLGGNQGNKVSLASFSSERVIGLRWPTGK